MGDSPTHRVMRLSPTMGPTVVGRFGHVSSNRRRLRRSKVHNNRKATIKCGPMWPPFMSLPTSLMVMPGQLGADLRADSGSAGLALH
jgi:hypothetical protein